MSSESSIILLGVALIGARKSITAVTSGIEAMSLSTIQWRNSRQQRMMIILGRCSAILNGTTTTTLYPLVIRRLKNQI